MTVEISEFMADALVQPGPDRRVFAIGDVHGQHEAFLDVLKAMKAAAAESAERTELVQLGDLIDRGPSSLRCIDEMMRPAETLGFDEKTVLMANHEQLARIVMDVDAGKIDLWLENGAKAIFAECGVPDEVRAHMNWAEKARAMRDCWGEARQAFLRELQPYRRIGNLLFVHAGLNPDVPKDEFLARPWDYSYRPTRPGFDEDHWAWIRFPFLNHVGGWGGDLVVHGHSPEPRLIAYEGEDPRMAHRIRYDRLDIDGGAGMSEPVAVAGAEFIEGGYRIYKARISESRARART